MGVGFWLTGQFADFGNEFRDYDFPRHVADWFSDHAGEPLENVREGQDSDGHPGVFVQLHPAAEELEVIVPEVGHVIASAKTSTVGPGYHMYVCDLLTRLGEDLSIQWDPPDDDEGTGDETGYFETGDRAAVETEMLRWLRAVMKDICEGNDNMMISMPLTHGYPNLGLVLTPTGPRDHAWRKATTLDPRNGIDIFPWWSPGISVDFYLGRALCRLWQDVRWRLPMFDREVELMEKVHQDLSRAFEIDPRRQYPFREWREILRYLKKHGARFDCGWPIVELEVDRRANEIDGGSLVGYRRNPVRTYLTGGWSIEIPGEMAEKWDEEGTWCAWDGQRTIWFTAFSRTNDDGTAVPARNILDKSADGDGELFEFSSETVLGRAHFAPYEEDGEELWNLKVRVAANGAFAICNFYFHDEQDRDWAISTSKSLHHA